MASTMYPPPPAPSSQMSFPRGPNDVASFDSRPNSFSSVSMQQSQQMAYPSTSNQASQNSNGSAYRSFGEVNGQRRQSMNQAPPETSQIYKAVYSSVAVYEMEVRGVAVMRRSSDSWLNATQILKVAGVDKGKRTKILEKEILNGQHEKIQGGYGKYQGTWINFHRGREFCRQYGVEELLRPLLDYDMGIDGNGVGQDTPTKEQAMAANRKRFYNSGLDSRANGQSANGTFFQNISPTASTALAAMHKAARYDSPLPRPGSAQRRAPGLARHESLQGVSQDSGFALGSQQSLHSFVSDNVQDQNAQIETMYSGMGSQTFGRPTDYQATNTQEPPRKKMKPSSQEFYENFDPSLQNDQSTQATEDFMNHTFGDPIQGPLALPPLNAPSDKSGEEKRLALLDLFADSSRTDFSSHSVILHLSGQDLDLPLDSSANTALHWAATLARVSLMRLLISKGANVFRGNAAGQTPLISAVLVNNSSDHSCFPEMLEVLGPLIEIRDATGRTVLHHIAVTSGIKGRGQSSRYYLESLLEFIVRRGSSNPSSSQLTFDPHTMPADFSKLKPIGLGRFMSEVVNIQDKSGNTALTLVARIGNRVIVEQLEEVGADFSIPNNTGLKPIDFGVFARSPATAQASSSQPLTSSQNKIPSQLDQIKEEIFATTTSILAQTQSQYTAEAQKKQEFVDNSNGELRGMTNVQAHRQEQIETVQQRAKERAERQHNISNMQRVVRAHQMGYSADNNRNLSDYAIDTSLHESSDPSAQHASLASLPDSAEIRERLAVWNANKEVVGQTHAALGSCRINLETRLQKVVALSTGVEEGKLEKLLDGLVAAAESEDGEAEVGRVRDFLRKVDA